MPNQDTSTRDEKGKAPSDQHPDFVSASGTPRTLRIFTGVAKKDGCVHQVTAIVHLADDVIRFIEVVRVHRARGPALWPGSL